jgi:hypothetical protein
MRKHVNSLDTDFYFQYIRLQKEKQSTLKLILSRFALIQCVTAFISNVILIYYYHFEVC